MKKLFFAGFLTLAAPGAVGCGGNYSNEDIDFQVALPERDELLAKLPGQAQVVADSAEYYVLTRQTVRLFNEMVDLFLGLIDEIRAYPATLRMPGRRIWGPFPLERQDGWQGRVTIDRIGDPARPERFQYFVEVRRAKDTTAPWLPVIQGHYVPGAGVRRGKGEMIFTAKDARAAGYPLKDLDGLDTIRIEHDRVDFPMRPLTVKVHIAASSGETIDYEYTENPDGSGEMMAAFPTPEGGALAEAATLHSRWLGSGAGQAVFRVVKGTLVLIGKTKNADCWGIDTRATYVYREGRPVDMRDPKACVFGPP